MDIPCNLLDNNHFGLGLLLSRHISTFQGECTVCSHTNGNHVLLRENLFFLNTVSCALFLMRSVKVEFSSEYFQKQNTNRLIRFIPY